MASGVACSVLCERPHRLPGTGAACHGGRVGQQHVHGRHVCSGRGLLPLPTWLLGDCALKGKTGLWRLPLRLKEQ